jgi:CheY-like chemotaxis protein
MKLINSPLKHQPQNSLNTPVLLVEDNRVNRVVMEKMLEKLGCQVTLAENGRQAVEILEQQNFSVIFMDIEMPEMDGFEATRVIRERDAYTSFKHLIVAMTANTMPDDVKKCLAAGMNDYIAKPISLEVFFELLKKYCPSYRNRTIQPAGFSKRTIDLSKKASQTTPPSDSTINQEQPKVLVVEDNYFSRMVITNMLKLFGCSVDVVENGQQAVDNCANHKYHLILMDIQMPVMDGVETTQIIRQHHHTPIIAVTANNQADDVKHYLAAGMNDCIGKPITVENVKKVVEKYLSLTASTEKMKGENEMSKRPLSQSSPNMPSVEDLPRFDAEQAKRIAIGNPRILEKIIDKFTEDTPNQLDKLQTALQQKHPKNAQRSAHSIKGSARSVGALRLGEVAFLAETAAKQDDLPQVEQLLVHLTNEWNQLQALWKKTQWETLFN